MTLFISDVPAPRVYKGLDLRGLAAVVQATALDDALGLRVIFQGIKRLVRLVFLSDKKDNRLPEESLNDPNRWVKEDRERMKRVVDSGNQMAGNLKTLNDKSMRIQARRTPKMDLSKMTDQEMREQINRAMLEKQYDDMFNPKKVYSGREAVSDTLEIAGSVLAITSSALGIALAIKELKG